MKTWTKKPPSAEGWYWVKYHGKHGLTRSPALVLKTKIEHLTMVDVARGGMYIFGRSKKEEEQQGVIWFGPCIPIPR